MTDLHAIAESPEHARWVLEHHIGTQTERSRCPICETWWPCDLAGIAALALKAEATIAFMWDRLESLEDESRRRHQRALVAEAEVVDLNERLIATKDELAFQAKNAADAHSERAYQFRRAADALEALSEIGDLLTHHRCVTRQDRPADVHPKIQEALDIIRAALSIE